MIVILTGAGISKESGLDTFRDAGGLWTKVSLEEVATPGGFARNPQKVYDFYNHRRREMANAQPNAAHLALARLEAEYNERVLVITQNIDDLHEKAGSRSLWHMHGELLKARCGLCGAVSPWPGDLGAGDTCPGCEKKGGLRPHMVWFEEIPLYLGEIEAALNKCRVFVSIGTSGDVYPAAGFVRLAKAKGSQTVELNLEPSRSAADFDQTGYGPATQVVPAWVEIVLAEKV